jgi:3D (Asp-Asp-Asp) domain-containing protein
VKGASAVPLIGRASVASDRSIIPAGTTLLAEVPLLDNNGKFNGQYELRLMVALDVGGAIKGQHFDIYQGIGPDAGHRAGWYNHYGRVWVLKTAPGRETYSAADCGILSAIRITVQGEETSPFLHLRFYVCGNQRCLAPAFWRHGTFIW